MKGIKLENELELFKETFQRSFDGIMVTDYTNSICLVNAAFEKITGYARDEVIGKKPNILSSGLYDANFYKKMWEQLLTEGYWKGRILNRKKTGEIYLERLDIYKLSIEMNTYYIAYISDITKAENAESNIILYEEIFENISEGIIISDKDKKIIKINPAFTKTTGYLPKEVYGKNPKILSSGRQPKEFYKEMWDSIDTIGTWSGEIWNKRKNGEIYPEWLTINVLRDENGNIKNYIGTFTDITQQKIPHNRLKQLAHYDALTGLPNRLSFQTELSDAIGKTADRRTIAVLYIDINQFRFVNDTYGHSTGDQLLIKFSNRLRYLLGDNVFISRISGVEFAILLDNIENIGDIQKHVSKIINKFNAPFYIKQREFQISLTIGISIFPFDAKDGKALINRAYTAMKQAKQLNRAYQFYEANIDDNVHRKLEIVNGLHRALKMNELTLYYQPQINIQTGEIVGLEALLRWYNKKLGNVSPGEFIPLAEETGLIVQIGYWVIEKVCAQLELWKQKGMKQIPVAINISPEHFKDPSFLIYLQKILAKYGLDTSLLQLEITENVEIENMEHVITILSKLKNMGIRVSIDDFGKGHSSFTYLKSLPISTLKIDRSFIANIHRDRYNASVVRAIMNISEGLGLQVIAEGVEDKEELFFLKDVSCEIAQGYLYAKPLPIEEVEEILDRRLSI